MNPKQVGNFEFPGMRITQDGPSITVNQIHYIESIQNLKFIKAEPSIFANLLGKLAWCLYCTHPDASYYAAKLAQTKSEDITELEMKMLKKAIRLLKNTIIQLTYPKLDLNTAILAVYSDSSFAANRDLHSQLGFVVLLVDGSKRCFMLHWNS